MEHRARNRRTAGGFRARTSARPVLRQSGALDRRCAARSPGGDGVFGRERGPRQWPLNGTHRSRYERVAAAFIARRLEELRALAPEQLLTDDEGAADQRVRPEDRAANPRAAGLFAAPRRIVPGGRVGERTAGRGRDARLDRHAGAGPAPRGYHPPAEHAQSLQPVRAASATRRAGFCFTIRPSSCSSGTTRANCHAHRRRSNRGGWGPCPSTDPSLILLSHKIFYDVLFYV